MSGIPPAREPITARPRANDSIATRGSPSDADGSRSARALSTAAASAAGSSRPLPLDAFAREAFRDLGLRSRPDQVQLRTGNACGGEPPAGCEHLDVLVALEHADEDHPRRLGHRARPGPRRPRDPSTS